MALTANGRYMFGGWQSIADAIRTAYSVTGERRPDQFNEDIPARDWNLIGTAIEYHADQLRPKCFNCTDPIDSGKDIRCLDCRVVFCPLCAPKHFWPNGRPKTEGTQNA